ncbi:MAG: hypothetical protein KGH56_01290 [Patescibacteria group bacterium]|nr:hypothetical protein [Patescibacteria group bacterium]
MNEFVSFLVFCQMVGALVGVFTAVWGEFAYIRSLGDGAIDEAERAHLDSIAKGLRFGMLTLLLSSFGLVVMSYLLQADPQPALSPGYWIIVTLALLIIGVSSALSRKRISFAFGSAIIFTGWWFLAYLALGWVPVISFGAAIAFYVVATGVLYAVLEYARLISRPSAQ